MCRASKGGAILHHAWRITPHLLSLSLARAVGNLPYDVTEQQLSDVFATAGPVKSVRCVRARAFSRRRRRSRAVAAPLPHRTPLKNNNQKGW